MALGRLEKRIGEFVKNLKDRGINTSASGLREHRVVVAEPEVYSGDVVYIPGWTTVPGDREAQIVERLVGSGFGCIYFFFLAMALQNSVLKALKAW